MIEISSIKRDNIFLELKFKKNILLRVKGYNKN